MGARLIHPVTQAQAWRREREQPWGPISTAYLVRCLYLPGAQYYGLHHLLRDMANMLASPQVYRKRQTKMNLRKVRYVLVTVPVPIHRNLVAILARTTVAASG